MPNPRRKLIEVSLPLEEINARSAREKSIRHGHPSTLHLWCARRPLATARAVLVSQLVDDPSNFLDDYHQDAVDKGYEDPDGWAEHRVKQERERLFELIKRMVNWDNLGDEGLFDQVRAEILPSTDGNPPAILDPFAGGRTIPLEAQRLGLEAHPTTRFAVAWYRGHGYDAGAFGDADNPARARATAVAALERDGILNARGGKVQLKKPTDLPSHYDVLADSHTSAWDALHYAIGIQETAGIPAAGAFLHEAPQRPDGAVDLDLVKELRLPPLPGRREERLDQGGHLLQLHRHILGRPPRRRPRGSCSERLHQCHPRLRRAGIARHARRHP